jgi:hypothetical protein
VRADPNQDVLETQTPIATLGRHLDAILILKTEIPCLLRVHMNVAQWANYAHSERNLGSRSLHGEPG